MVDIRPDTPGEYVVKVSVRLVFDDDLYPGKRVASSEFKLTAEGEPVGGCATGGTGGLMAVWLLVGVALFLRRKQ